MDINQYISSGIIEMHVMGLCSPEESNELELLRTLHPRLNEAVFVFEKAFENTLMQHATEQPDTVTDKKILKSLQAMPTPVLPMLTGNVKVKSLNWFKPAAAAAAVLFAISSIFNYTLYKKIKIQELALAETKKVTSLPQNDYAVLKTPGITPVAMYGVGYHSICRCTLFWDKKTGKAYMMIHHLVPSGTEKQYQLWAMVDDKPVNIGVVDDTIRDRFVELKNIPEGATAFTVTLENAAGSTTPTLEETYVTGKII
jgi:hypothetical protein